MNDRQTIAEELLGCRLEEGGYAPCPGKQHHTKNNGPRDFRVLLDGAPTGYCLHTSCGAEVDAFNKELRRRIWRAENGMALPPQGSWAEGVAAEPKQEKKTRPPIDTARVEEFTRGVPAIDHDWLRRRSPVDVVSITPVEFLQHLYQPEERVLVFTQQYSQGNFIFWHGHGTYRLGNKGVKAVPSALPGGGPDGVWFLTQPVTGEWSINANQAKAGGDSQWSRRWEGSVTAWRYFVLESDELDEALWLKVLANLAVPVAAVYTSGGRSVHALLKMEVPSKAEWDAMKRAIIQLVCPLGADPAAITAVRLSRLPGCQRGNKLQKLLYLDPAADDHEPLRLKREVRP